MTIATCLICQAPITSMIIGDIKTRMIDLGQLMLEHLGKFHMDAIERIKISQPLLNGLLVLNEFEFNDDSITDEHEDMREKACELIMKNAPDYDEEFEDEDAVLDAEDELRGEYANEIIDMEPTGKPGEYAAPAEPPYPFGGDVDRRRTAGQPRKRKQPVPAV